VIINNIIVKAYLEDSIIIIAIETLHLFFFSYSYSLIGLSNQRFMIYYCFQEHFNLVQKLAQIFIVHVADEKNG